MASRNRSWPSATSPLSGSEYMDEGVLAEMRLRSDLSGLINAYLPMGPEAVVYWLDRDGLLYDAQRLNLVPHHSPEKLVEYYEMSRVQTLEVRAELVEAGIITQEEADRRNADPNECW